MMIFFLKILHCTVFASLSLAVPQLLVVVASAGVEHGP